jgi:DNA-binding SARP family transcriptional activator/flavin reductase (DIM6/NTAB) family NADH-FMN oxidoreductase RutF
MIATRDAKSGGVASLFRGALAPRPEGRNGGGVVSRSMEFRLLGPLEVLRDQVPVRIAAGKQGTLLAILLLNANRTVSREQLIDSLWGEDAPDTAPKMVQIQVSHLRKALPEARLYTRPPGYMLEVREDELDVFRFERAVADAREALSQNDSRKASELLAGALTLWRGPALTEFSEPFGSPEGARLEELRLAAIELSIDAALALGHHRDVVGELETLTAQHPLREHLRFQQMLALYRSRRHAEALAGYRAYRRTLSEGLGIEPSASLRELERQMLRQDPSLDLAAPTETRTVVPTPAGRADGPALSGGALPGSVEAPEPTADEFADAISTLESSVVIVTCQLDGRPSGMTVTSFAPVSADPPTVLVSLDRGTSVASAVAATGRFGVSILRGEQLPLARYGSNPGGPALLDRLADPERLLSPSPAIADALAHLDCQVAGEIQVADHTVFFGQVRAAQVQPDGEALLHHLRGYPTIGIAAPDNHDYRTENAVLHRRTGLIRTLATCHRDSGGCTAS